jgi:ABC-type amino acid transport substrate-binding protein
MFEHLKMLKSMGIAAALCLAGATSTFAASVDEIKARGTLIIGAEIASPPYISRVNNEIVGYEPDMLNYMAKKLGVKLQIVDAAWSGILPALLTGKFDAVYSGMTMTKDRVSKVAFTMPYAQDPVSIMVYSESDIHKIQDMSGKRLGYAFGGALDKFITGYNDKLKGEGKAPVDLKTYDTPLDAIADLQNRRLDAALNKRSTLMGVIHTRKLESKFRVVSDVKDMVDLSYLMGGAIPKDNPTLLKFMNDCLQEMKDDGTLTALQKKWFGETMELPTTLPDNLP